MNAVLAEPIQCERCADRRRVWNDTLRRFIRCTQCTVVRLPYDPHALKRLARTERKRLRLQSAVVLIELLAIELPVFTSVPPELVTTDRVLDRWAAFGTGMPSENPDVYRVSLPPPLDENTQVIVSAIVQRAAKRVRSVTYDLYSRGAAPAWVARKLRMEPRSFRRYAQEILRQHRDRFLASGHSDLVNLIRVPP